AGYAEEGEPGVHCAGDHHGRGAGVALGRVVACAQARPDYRATSDAGKRDLGLPANLGATRMLTRELQDFRERMTSRGAASFGAWREGQHDDLVVATALACWRAPWKAGGVWGTRSLGLW